MQLARGNYFQTGTIVGVKFVVKRCTFRVESNLNRHKKGYKFNLQML